MPRVIAGTARGRRLRGPDDDRVRPTTDRTKEALFSMLQTVLVDARVLDLYAGSGALGVEALSRGAASAVLVERDRRALAVVGHNLAAAGVADRATVVGRDVGAALRSGAVGPGPFDVVLADPPYDLPDATLADVLAALQDLVADGAVVSVERDRRSDPPPWPAWLVPRAPRRHGTSILHLADREQNL